MVIINFFRLLFKKALGFGSEYSWMKWMKIAFATIALIITFAFWSNFGFMIFQGGIIGAILAIVLFIVIFGPLLLLMMGGAGLVGVVIGGIISGKKQRKSFKETAQTGSAELMALEKLRMKSQGLDLLFILAVIGLIILGFLIVEFLYDSIGEAGLYGYMILSAVVLIVFWAKKAPVKARYKTAFKEQVVVKGLESVLDNIFFRPQQKLDEALVKAAALFPRYDVYTGNDYLAADYNGHHFIQSDISLQEKREETYRDDDGNIQTRTKHITLFRGRLMVLDYNAVSDEPVVVYARDGRKPKSSEEIQTELDAFNQKFYIVASSPEAALRILTPPVLEGIVLASNKLNYPLYLSFREDKLFVALASGDSFEAAGGDTTLSEQRRKVTDEIKAMLDLIDNLYLINRSQEGGI